MNEPKQTDPLLAAINNREFKKVAELAASGPVTEAQYYASFTNFKDWEKKELEKVTTNPTGDTEHSATEDALKEFRRTENKTASELQPEKAIHLILDPLVDESIKISVKKKLQSNALLDAIENKDKIKVTVLLENQPVEMRHLKEAMKQYDAISSGLMKGFPKEGQILTDLMKKASPELLQEFYAQANEEQKETIALRLKYIEQVRHGGHSL